MGRLRMVRELLRDWRKISESDGRRPGLALGALLILLSPLVRWPRQPPRIEPFIYAHF